MTCNCACSATVARLEEDLHAVEARVVSLEVGRQEHAAELASFGVRLGEVQLTLDRLVSKVTTSVLTSERVEKQQVIQGRAIAQLAEASGQQTLVLQQLHSMMTDVTTRLTKSVEVPGA